MTSYVLTDINQSTELFIDDLRYEARKAHNEAICAMLNEAANRLEFYDIEHHDDLRYLDSTMDGAVNNG